MHVATYGLCNKWEGDYWTEGVVIFWMVLWSKIECVKYSSFVIVNYY